MDIFSFLCLQAPLSNFWLCFMLNALLGFEPRALQMLSNGLPWSYIPTTLFLVLLGPLYAFLLIVSPLIALRPLSSLIALFKEHILPG